MLHHQYYDQNEENMIKGLDDDEIEFLDLVDRTKLAADRKKELEEEQELNDYRNRVATLHEQAIEERLQAEINNINKPKAATNRTSQQKLLKGIVVKKGDAKKRKNSDSSNNEEEIKRPKLGSDDKPEKTESEKKIEEKVDSDSNGSEKLVPVSGAGLQCVAILPGLGCYNDSTSDENSSDSEVEHSSSKIDILGRKILKKTDKES